jgi:hypothetical protein
MVTKGQFDSPLEAELLAGLEVLESQGA